MDREFSPDPDIRQKSHFEGLFLIIIDTFCVHKINFWNFFLENEGYMQSQDLNQALARAISDEDVQVSYKYIFFKNHFQD